MKITDNRKDDNYLSFSSLSIGSVFEFKHNNKIYIKIDNNNFHDNNAFCLSEKFLTRFNCTASVLLVEAHLILERNK